MKSNNRSLTAWIALALLGVPLGIAAKVARFLIGCPWFGDCQLPGSQIHDTLEILFYVWFFLLPFMVLRIFRIKTLGGAEPAPAPDKAAVQQALEDVQARTPIRFLRSKGGLLGDDPPQDPGQGKRGD